MGKSKAVEREPKVRPHERLAQQLKQINPQGYTPEELERVLIRAEQQRAAGFKDEVVYRDPDDGLYKSRLGALGAGEAPPAPPPSLSGDVVTAVELLELPLQGLANGLDVLQERLHRVLANAPVVAEMEQVMPSRVGQCTLSSQLLMTHASFQDQVRRLNDILERLAL